MRHFIVMFKVCLGVENGGKNGIVSWISFFKILDFLMFCKNQANLIGFYREG
jgi:hypothetical protein